MFYVNVCVSVNLYYSRRSVLFISFSDHHTQHPVSRWCFRRFTYTSDIYIDLSNRCELRTFEFVLRQIITRNRR